MKNIVIIDGHGDSGNLGSVNNVGVESINSLSLDRNLCFYNIARPAETVSYQDSNREISSLWNYGHTTKQLYLEASVKKGQPRLTSSIQNKSLYRIGTTRSGQRQWELANATEFKRFGHLRICQRTINQSRIFYVRVRYTYEDKVSYEYIISKMYENFDGEFGNSDLEFYWAACRSN